MDDTQKRKGKVYETELQAHSLGRLCILPYQRILAGIRYHRT